MKHLHIDIETRCSVDITKAGHHAYTEAPDFEILMVAYALDEDPVEIVDLTREEMPESLVHMLEDSSITKAAHNAAFERNAFKAYGIDIPAEEWYCTAVHAHASGFPGSLAGVSGAMALGDKAKDAAGRALIRLFSVPKKDGTFVQPEEEPERWEEFLEYCKQDVVAEREVAKRLQLFPMDRIDVQHMYALDQKINDKGVLIDKDLAESAAALASEAKEKAVARMAEITGLDNPNSVAQLKKWLKDEKGITAKSLNKESVKTLLKDSSDPEVREVLTLRGSTSLSSVSKYTAAVNRTTADGRVKGTLQFHGAGRTGRWAGRGIQVQNLPRNKVDDLSELRDMRDAVKSRDIELLDMLYGEVNPLLKELTRTMIIAPEGKKLVIADYSAIEARVLAWMAGERWRLDVFNTHGKLYEASASAIYKKPIDQVTDTMRQTGKIAELALGYGGSIGALLAFGADKMGMDELSMRQLVQSWRAESPSIVRFWNQLEKAAQAAMSLPKPIVFGNLRIFKIKTTLVIELPSGRRLYYQNAVLMPGKFGQEIRYQEMTSAGWQWVNTYGGKLTENVVQAIAADLLRYALIRAHNEGIDICMHVHDEVVAEEDENLAEHTLDILINIMGQNPSWAKGLPLGADGFTSQFYKK